MRSLPLTVGVLLVGLSSYGVAHSPTPVPKQFVEEREFWDKLEDAYKAGRPTRDFSALKEVLEERFADRRETIRDGTLRWLGKHYNDLTVDELSEFFQIYWRLQPDDSRSDGLRHVLAECRLAHSSRAERASVYWQALRDRKVDIGGPQPLTWMEALGKAAGEGMDEFRAAIEQHAAEVDALPGQKGTKWSDSLLWELTLRSGAQDEIDAHKLAAQRILGMPTTKVAGLMEDDPAFRGVVENLARVVCEEGRPISEPCRNLASTYLRLEQYSEQKQGEAQAMQSSAPKALDKHQSGSSDWLAALRRATEVAATEIRSEPSPRPTKNR
jgi:hypothetical protein